MLLSLLPASWSERKIQSELNLKSRHSISDLKKLKLNEGNESKKTNKNALSAETIEAVLKFYEREDNSRELPGMKEFKSVKMADGSRQHIRKKLILSNLKELYEKFKEEYPIKIGFTKFSQFRPLHCVLAGSSGTHTVCVCEYHQNVKLSLEGRVISINENYEIKKLQ